MEIHELNTFSGTLGASDYFATDNGSDTSKVSASDLYAPLNARIDNIIAGGTAPSEAEVTDARLGASVLGGVTYSSLGAAIRGQATELYEDISEEINGLAVESFVGIDSKEIVSIPLDSGLIENGAYNNATGEKIPASGFKRTVGLFRANEHELYVSNANNDVYMNCYDAEKNHIAQIIVRGHTNETIRTPKVTPSGTVFVALSSTGDFNIKKISSKDFTGFEYPFTSGCHYVSGAYMNSSGYLVSNASFASVYFADVEEGERFYVNENDSQTFVCFDENGTVLTHGETYEQRGTVGRVYTVPEGTKWLAINITKTNAFDGHISSYIAKCAGEKILCIGASITWLDGSRNYDNMAVFVGYQKQLRMKGFDVYSYGYSGYCFAYTNGEYGSIYTEIVSNQRDVSGFDYIILSDASYNDVLHHLPVGTYPTVYNDYNYDVSTTLGALQAIIKYIRDNNSNAKILLTTFPKSEAVNRSWLYTIDTYNALKYLAIFESCKLVDQFADINIQAFTDAFDENFVDDTHPNYYGMAKVGKLILQKLEEYTDYNY